MSEKVGFEVKKIQEGSANAFISTGEKISKKLPAFYNPHMKLNRDINVALINALNRP